MRLASLATACLLSLSVACETTVENSEAAQGGSGAGTPSSDCAVPDTSCPADMPFPGSPCEGALSCPYDDFAPWEFTCESGAWVGEQNCDMIVGGACNVPPAAEGCGPVFTGERAASVGIGPSTSNQTFVDGEEAEIVWGGQGSAMIFFRLHVDDDAAPACVLVTSTVAPTGMTPVTTKSPVTLRCGQSLRMYVVLPDGECSSSEPVATTLTIDVAGVGTREVTLMVPGEAFCGSFG